ncbi:MAG: calcium/sodium antiporter [Bacteroidaceae bacterium]|nr:calcium/sodium antiporter [Bacteroidaceae bacterium]
MLLDVILIVVGIALVLKGADWFTDGACDLARRWGVSELVIGLTVVAMGTSLPEFSVSLFSLLLGSADMSAGNVVGSNIFNTLIIVGASSLLMTIPVERSTTSRELPLCLLATLALCACGVVGEVSRCSALLLLGLFCLFMAYSVRLGLRQKSEAARGGASSVWRTLLLLVAGVAALVIGGQTLVNSSADVARWLGVSEAVIGLTILAGGTSLPELATSLVAARKGSSGLALGNVVGSNIFNITFVLGVCGIVRPLGLAGLADVDWWALVVSLVLLWLFSVTRRSLSRREGVLLLLCYAVYLAIRLCGG